MLRSRQVAPSPGHQNFQLWGLKGSENYLSSFGKKGGKLGEFQDAKDIRVLPEDRLLITDHINSRLQICDKSGNSITEYSGDNVLQPWSAAVSRDECIIFTSCREKSVIGLNTDGEKVSDFGQNLFMRPCGLAIDGRDRVIVSDMLSNRVTMHEADGTFIRYLGNNANSKQMLSKPQYVCVSTTSDILIADSGNHSVKIYNCKGDFVKCIGRFGKENGQFKSPHGICTNKEGEIFVADHYNSRVSVFTRDGTFLRHIVTAEDGLVHPQGLAIDDRNRLYVTHGHLKASQVLVLKISKDADAIYPNIISHV